MSILEKLLQLIIDSLILTLEISVGMFGSIFVIGLLLFLLAHFTRNLFSQTFGYRAEIFISAWIGTPVHEMGHVIFCLLFGHKIQKVTLFSPNARDGSLGSVSHSYNSRNIYHRIGNFFIGSGPIIFGSLIIFMLIKYLLPTGYAVTGRLDADILTAKADLAAIPLFLKTVWSQTLEVIPVIFSGQNFGQWQFWLFMYFSLAISSHMELSPPDLKQMWNGFLIILLVIFIFNLIYLIFFSRFDNLLFSGANLTGYLDHLLLFGLLFSMINFLLTWMITGIFGLLFYRKIPNPFVR
jgi:hypothetical protein